MITRRVVLILGAGASNPYGFPLAKELLESAVAGEEHLVPRLVDAGFDKPEIKTFMAELLRAQLPSIDAFLEYRPEFMQIGKAALALYLIACEREDWLIDPRNDEHWYRYLYHQMKTIDLREFANNTLSVITFNYDRSLEHFLTTALMAGHGKSPDDVFTVLKDIPIIHPYGQLGSLPGQGGQERPYDTTLTPEILRKAMDGIRIVSETADQTAQFRDAHALIREAQEIVFLGFGYHRENVERLELERHLPAPARVTGTVVGFTTSEFNENVQSLFRSLAGNQLSENNERVLTFLRGNLELLGVRH